MRQELLFRRIATKVDLDPSDFLEMMAGTLPFPDHCLIWTGATTQGGLTRDRGYIYARRVRPRILKHKYLPRYLLDILYGPQTRFTRACDNPLCINPDHWVQRGSPVTDEPGWTRDEARELITLYLVNNTYPLDPTHPLLQDIPLELLNEF